MSVGAVRERRGAHRHAAGAGDTVPARETGAWLVDLCGLYLGSVLVLIQIHPRDLSCSCSKIRDNEKGKAQN